MTAHIAVLTAYVMNTSHKHSEISRHLLTEIAAGKYSASDRLPSEAQLVKQFKVSRPTIARAFRDLMADGIIERRAGSGTFVSQKGVRTETRQIGLLIPGLATTEIFQSICGEIASLARVHDYGLFWGGSPEPLQDRDDSLGHAEDLCQQFIRRKLSGVFFAPVEWHPGQKEANLHLAEMLRDAGIPVVLLDRDFSEFPQRSNFDLVGIDNMAGGYLLAEHLIKLGCRRIFFVAHPLSAQTVDARIAGWREALVRHRIEPGPDWVQTGNPTDIKFVRSLVAGRQADAFVCARDDTAAMLMRAMENIGMRVPQHFRVVGFDDVKYATLVSVPLTTIHQPCREIAMIAFRTMLERIAEPTLPPRTISLMPHLVVRESCGAYLPRSLPGERSGKSKRFRQ